MGKKVGAAWTAVLLLLAMANQIPECLAQNGVCSGVNCQRGTCKPAFIGYTCDCLEGWGNLLGLSFLPCGIPKNCHVNLTCDGKSEGPAPALSPPAPALQLPNLTSFNPCTFSLCGYGKCVEKENPGFLMAPYTCECNPGNSNALNMSSGVCLPDCNFLGGCPDLGIPLSGSTPAPPPPPSSVTFPPNAGGPPSGSSPALPPSNPTFPQSAGRRVEVVAAFMVAAAVGATSWLLV